MTSEKQHGARERYLRRCCASWPRARLSELGEIQAGKARSPHGHNGTLRPYLRVANVFDGHIDTSDVSSMLFTDREWQNYRLSCGDILLNEGQSLHLVGRAAQYHGEPQDCGFQNSLIRFKAGPRVDGSFALTAFRFFQQTGIFSEVALQTTSIAHLGVSRFANIEMAVPTLPEQRGIAAILSAVDAAVEATQAVIDQLQIIKKAMMNELLTLGVPGRHTRFKSCVLGPIPATWSLARLEDVTERVRTTVEVNSDKFYREIGVRSHAKGIFHKAAVLGKELGAKRVFSIEPDCLVVNIVFAWEGAVAATSRSEAGMIASHRFPLLRPRKGLVSLHYLRLLLQSQRGIELLGSISPGGAGRNRTLNQGAFLRLELPLPPLEEQESVAEAIMSIEARLAAESEKHLGNRALKSALMSALLTGEIRVTPDEAAP